MTAHWPECEALCPIGIDAVERAILGCDKQTAIATHRWRCEDSACGWEGEGQRTRGGIECQDQLFGARQIKQIGSADDRAEANRSAFGRNEAPYEGASRAQRKNITWIRC